MSTEDGEDSGQLTEPGTPQTVSSNETTTVPNDGTAPSDDGEDTLAGLFGLGGADPQEAELRLRDEEAHREELIRQCMAEAGFDYIPVIQPEASFGVFDLDQEAFVREFGFGITTWYGNEDLFGQEVEWVDPNQEMVEAMSDAEREAYREALNGTAEEQQEGMDNLRFIVDPETGHREVFAVAGCWGKAQEELFGHLADTYELWEQILPQMDAMHERILADPRIAEWDQNWSVCMAEAGYDFESRRQSMSEGSFGEFEQQLADILGPNMGFVDPFEGMSPEEIDAFFAGHTDDEIQAFIDQAEQEHRADIDEDALFALQQEEIALAVADFECAAGYDDIYQEVAADYEADFIAENRAILEQIRNAQDG